MFPKAQMASQACGGNCRVSGCREMSIMQRTAGTIAISGTIAIHGVGGGELRESANTGGLSGRAALTPRRGGAASYGVSGARMKIPATFSSVSNATRAFMSPAS